MIENVEDDVDKLPNSDFSKAAARVFDKIESWDDGVLTFSKFVDLIETLGEGFHIEDIEGHRSKLDPNESGILDRLPL